jgi:TPR repeat protein
MSMLCIADAAPDSTSKSDTANISSMDVWVIKLKAYTGNVEAQTKLGMFYYNGQQVPQYYK